MARSERPGSRPTPSGAPPDELTDDALCGKFRVWQRRRGHRYSLDDVVTAWTACIARPRAVRAVDLGCGIGSVLLMLAYKLPYLRLVGVEAYGGSFELARRNVHRNGVERRVTLFHGDLRHAAIQARSGLGVNDLVVGTPPYFPPEAATPSPDPQRAAARTETRGGIEDYLTAAGKLVAPTGVVVICTAAGAEERIRAGAGAASLHVETRRPVVPRARKKGPLFDVWTLTPVERFPEPETLPPFFARDEGGARTAQERALRRWFDLPARDDEAPSP